MTTKQGIRKGDDGKARCWWCGDDPLYVAYHDDEWGRRTVHDRALFEKLCLEGFQCGLSWLTILRRRENFRRAFHNFEIERVARMTARDINRLVKDEGIIRHRGKIESTVNNAKRALDLIETCGSLYAYFEPSLPVLTDRKAPRSAATIPATTPESTAISKDLKKRGWSYVGPTTIYAFMQAVGMVNDHLVGCDFRTPPRRSGR